MFQGSDDMVNWVDIEHRSTANHQWSTNEERIFWVGVPTGIPGIPQDDFDQYNVRERADTVSLPSGLHTLL